MPLIIIAILVFALAYRFYYSFIAAKVAVINDNRRTPAGRFYDGQNFYPMSKWVLFGHHFAAIAGAGPLVGPVLAAQFGYLPGFLWMIVGAVMAGAVHDLIILTASIRHDGKSLAEIARAFRVQAAEVKRVRDPAFGACFRIVSLLPWRLVRGFLNLGSWLVYGLNLNLGFLGLPKDPFGSVMITNVGGMGIDVAWAPLVPYTRVPLLLALGAIRDKAVVENGEVKARPVLSVGVTFDHRLIDGVHAAQMSDEFKRCFADPVRYFGEPAPTG